MNTSAITSVDELRVVKATSIGNDGRIFYMEIHNEPGKFVKVELVDRPEGPMKSWSHSDKFSVKDENGNVISFQRHKFAGPVFLVIPLPDENKKEKNYRVTFYTIRDSSDNAPLPKRATKMETNSAPADNEPDTYVMTDEERGYDSSGRPVRKEGEPERAYRSRMQKYYSMLCSD